MRSANVRVSENPETPPLAPYDPPDPAPQAAAWRRALRVIGYVPPTEYRMGKNTLVRTTLRKA
jgi:hypothetical protein